MCIFSTFMTEETRRAMGEQSTQLALAVGYDSAGGNHTAHWSLKAQSLLTRTY